MLLLTEAEKYGIIKADSCDAFPENVSKVVGFRYNAWGMFNTDVADSDVCTDTFIKASLFRYRSYIYDYEIGLYYLQSRYYDPEIGRFINADGCINANGDLVGYNMYAYCSNNPVMFIDPTGESWVVALIIGVIVLETLTFTIPNKSQHYARNSHNITPNEDELDSIVSGIHPDWEAAPDKANKFHKFTTGTQGEEAVYNTKYMSKNGKYEVIICYDSEMVPTPYVVTDPCNVGTYNYAPGSGLPHALFDVFPYIFYGNTESDITDPWERICCIWS